MDEDRLFSALYIWHSFFFVLFVCLLEESGCILYNASYSTILVLLSIVIVFLFDPYFFPMNRMSLGTWNERVSGKENDLLWPDSWLSFFIHFFSFFINFFSSVNSLSINFHFCSNRLNWTEKKRIQVFKSKYPVIFIKQNFGLRLFILFLIKFFDRLFLAKK